MQTITTIGLDIVQVDLAGPGVDACGQVFKRAARPQLMVFLSAPIMLRRVGR